MADRAYLGSWNEWSRDERLPIELAQGGGAPAAAGGL